ncbi:condensation domain-containing protein, partial [Salmonella enterica]|uniref:condensation domain-containing protein n=1 Tax=Salmonella enterica TaxID=28901 RepID=UPI0022B6A9DD
RTCFKSDKSGFAQQYILPVDAVNFKLIQEDFSSVNNKQAAVSDYLLEQSSVVFDLEKTPLLRAGLVILEEQKHLFFLSMHHIIGD